MPTSLPASTSWQNLPWQGMQITPHDRNFKDGFIAPVSASPSDLNRQTVCFLACKVAAAIGLLHSGEYVVRHKARPHGIG